MTRHTVLPMLLVLALQGQTHGEDTELRVAVLKVAVERDNFRSAFHQLLHLVEMSPRSDQARQALDYLVDRVIPTGVRPLTRIEASYLAAKYANGKCKEFFGRSPFDSRTYDVVQIEEMWDWGRLDPAGLDGYSAHVTLSLDGTQPTVKVYLSTDGIFPNTYGLSPRTRSRIEQ